MLFPALRAANPDLAPVVDRLEADHRKVSILLDEVEAACRELDDEEESASRSSLVAALDDLAEQLLEHLGFEEESVDIGSGEAPDCIAGRAHDRFITHVKGSIKENGTTRPLIKRLEQTRQTRVHCFIYRLNSGRVIDVGDGRKVQL